MLKYLLSTFRGLQVPKKLEELIKFNDGTGRNSFYHGFKFYIESERNLLKTYSIHKNFLDSIYEFATANTVGSVYAFWLTAGKTSLDDAPIIIIGSEGRGIYLVANNFDDFLAILSIGIEPKFDTGLSPDFLDYEFNKPKSQKYNNYHAWLKNKYNITPIEVDIDNIDHLDDILFNRTWEYEVKLSGWLAFLGIQETYEESTPYIEPSPKPPHSPQEATQQLKQINNIQMIRNKEIKIYLEKNPIKNEMGKYGVPQDKYRYNFYGSNSMEYDIWRKGEKK